MNIIVEINGRQAIPVRALPLLTDWVTMSPDVVARALAGDVDYWPFFQNLRAYRLLTDGTVDQIPPRWWASWVVGPLQAKSDNIKVEQTSHDTGYQQWRRESIAHLPAGVFVWCDEFEVAHDREYGAESMRARSTPEAFKTSTYALNFTPEPLPDIAPQHLVLEGFEPRKPAPQPLTVVETNAAQAVELTGLSAVPIEETPEERRARWLAMYEKNGGASKRGALAALARELNVDRSNLRKELNRATKQREEKRRAGALGVASRQLVKDGKRPT